MPCLLEQMKAARQSSRVQTSARESRDHPGQENSTHLLARVGPAGSTLNPEPKGFFLPEKTAGTEN